MVNTNQSIFKNRIVADRSADRLALLSYDRRVSLAAYEKFETALEAEGAVILPLPSYAGAKFAILNGSPSR